MSPESAQKSIIELGVTLKGSERSPLRISLPLELSVLDPFTVSVGSLHLVPKGIAELSVRTTGDCENLEIVEAKCEMKGTTVEIADSVVQLSASETSESQTGYLHLKLKCRGKDKSERLFSKFVLVQLTSTDSIDLSVP